MSLRIELVASAALLLTTGASFATPEICAPVTADAPLHEALRAVDLGDPARTESERVALCRRLREVVERIGPGRPTYRRAERLHRLLHRDYLLDYREDADELQRLASRGEYNCLSATLFYGVVARELGFGVRVLELPGHLLLEIEAGGRWIRVETTSARGFDRKRSDPSLSSDGRGGTTYLLAPGHGRADAGRGYRRVSLEQAVAFAWLNSAWRAIDRGETVRAASAAALARGFLSGESIDADAQRVFTRAFRAEYESGDFDDAYRIASIEVRQFPEPTTPRDRLFASAVKRVEDACDDDDPALAAEIVREVADLSGASREAGRFERRAWPLVGASAVRLGDWDLARRAAERYARVEPDRVEAQRVIDWVEARMQQDPDGAWPRACAVPAGHESR